MFCFFNLPLHFPEKRQEYLLYQIEFSKAFCCISYFTLFCKTFMTTVLLLSFGLASREVLYWASLFQMQWQPQILGEFSLLVCLQEFLSQLGMFIDRFPPKALHAFSFAVIQNLSVSSTNTFTKYNKTRSGQL